MKRTRRLLAQAAALERERCARQVECMAAMLPAPGASLARQTMHRETVLTIRTIAAVLRAFPRA